MKQNIYKILISFDLISVFQKGKGRKAIVKNIVLESRSNLDLVYKPRANKFGEDLIFFESLLYRIGRGGIEIKRELRIIVNKFEIIGILGEENLIETPSLKEKVLLDSTKAPIVVILKQKTTKLNAKRNSTSKAQKNFESKGSSERECSRLF